MDRRKYRKLGNRKIDRTEMILGYSFHHQNYFRALDLWLGYRFHT